MDWLHGTECSDRAEDIVRSTDEFSQMVFFIFIFLTHGDEGCGLFP